MAGELKSFQCPNCGAGVSIRAQGRSLSVVCGSCHSVIDSSNENYQIISKSQNEAVRIPDIPLGRRGELRGVKYEVVGYMVRCDGTGGYEWREYLLYNPYKGFFWLVENQGHWSFVTVVKGPSGADIYSENVKYNNLSFRRFLRDSAKVVFVSGEFYWQVRVGEKANTCDYIEPPFMLSTEYNESESVWSLGEYLLPEEVSYAFRPMTKLDKALRLPFPIGVAPNQPTPYRNSEMTNVWLSSLVFICFLFVITKGGMEGSMNNFFTGLLAVLGWPIWDLMRSQSFEKQRWSNSDCSPYESYGDFEE